MCNEVQWQSLFNVQYLTDLDAKAATATVRSVFPAANGSTVVNLSPSLHE